MAIDSMSSPREAVTDIRNALPQESRQRSMTKRLMYFTVRSALHGISFLAIFLPHAWAARIALALLNGLCVGIVFIVEHDACHGSLTPRSPLNR
jgi:acyl-lipid omega-6 desaturase (Delta-12 desaturase)